MIDKALGLDNPDPVETYSSSPHLYAELNIPTDATGSVGKATRTTEKPKRDREREREPRSDGDKPTRNRTRQRTRGGQSATGHVENTDAQAPEAGESDSPARKRRRRRRPNSAATTAG
jgi:hypothetical protein